MGRKTNIRVARIRNMKRFGEGRGLAKNCRDENFWLGGQGTLDQVSERVGEHKGVHSKEIEEKVKMPQK